MDVKDTGSRLKSLSDQTQVDNAHTLQEESVITEQTSNINEVETCHETAKRSDEESDLVSKQSLELALEQGHIQEVIIFLFSILITCPAQA